MSVQQPDPISPPSISSAVASPARISATLERVRGWLVRALACGESTRGSLASYDPDSCAWKTSQLCLDGERTLFSETWPASGTMQSGRLYAPRMSERHIDGSGCSSSDGWPTIRAGDPRNSRSAIVNAKNHPSGASGLALEQAVEAIAGVLPRELNSISELPPRYQDLWPTPTTRDWKSGQASQETLDRNARPLNEVVTMWATPSARDPKQKDAPNRQGGPSLCGQIQNAGKLNPSWVSQLMGFPDGWLDGLPVPEKCKPSGKRHAQSASATTEPQDSKPSETP